MKKLKKVVAVIGMGYVGFPLVELLVKSKKYSVLGLEISEERVRFAKKQLGKNDFTATTDSKALKQADIVVVCVPTPVKDSYEPDYGPLVTACEAIAQNLKKGQLVIIESTINPGTCEEVVVPVFQKHGFQQGKDYLLAHCPERIDPGNKKWTLINIPRNVGGVSPKAAKLAGAFYRSFLKAPIQILTTIKAAEATKIVENTFRDINIAYVNELAMSFDAMGIDLTEVITGAASKPFAFMPHFPGIGVGGHCIAVDPYYLIERAKKSGFEHRFLKIAREVNNGMPAYTVSLLERELKKLGISFSTTRVGLLGLAYKKDIEDMRESPAYEALKILKRKGAVVETFDPFIPAHSTTKSLTELINKCPVLIIATNHTAFKSITGPMLRKAGVRLVIDGRNMLNKKELINAGVTYKGVGH